MARQRLSQHARLTVYPRRGPPTALRSVASSARPGELRGLVIGANDDTIVDAARQADNVGIDCPLGWPAPFVEFVAAHQRGNVSIPPDLLGLYWRRRLAYRLTDLAVRRATGQRPLSVTADRVGHTAIRAAGLLARLPTDGQPVDRTGTGVVVEVYPRRSRDAWNCHTRSSRVPRTSLRSACWSTACRRRPPVAGPRRVRERLSVLAGGRARPYDAAGPARRHRRPPDLPTS